MEALPRDSPLRKLHPDDVYPDGTLAILVTDQSLKMSSMT